MGTARVPMSALVSGCGPSAEWLATGLLNQAWPGITAAAAGPGFALGHAVRCPPQQLNLGNTHNLASDSRFPCSTMHVTTTTCTDTKAPRASRRDRGGHGARRSVCKASLCAVHGRDTHGRECSVVTALSMHSAKRPQATLLKAIVMRSVAWARPNADWVQASRELPPECTECCTKCMLRHERHNKPTATVRAV